MKTMSKLTQAHMCIGLGKLRTKVLFFFFSPPVFQTENKKHILRGYIK